MQKKKDDGTDEEGDVRPDVSDDMNTAHLRQCSHLGRQSEETTELPECGMRKTEEEEAR